MSGGDKGGFERLSVSLSLEAGAQWASSLS
jgi:hypothetical protein